VTGVTEIDIQLARRREARDLAAMSRRLVEAGLEPSWTLERIERHIQHPDSVAIVARTASRGAGQLAGFAIMQYGDTTAHLNLLAVEPRFRRAGVGRRLVRWLEESAVVAGTFTIGLELRSSNAVAERFYLALGYREVGRVRGYYQRVEDAIRMRKELAVGEPLRR
jgi:ribosomal-protein-alanine N-acetyltransferase